MLGCETDIVYNLLHINHGVSQINHLIIIHASIQKRNYGFF
jgi:hypothetical protein